MKSRVLLFLSIIIFGAFTLQQETHTLYIIGDSTASDYSASSYPRTGWGTMMKHYFDNALIEVDNRALSGRSSKSFYNESGAWDQVIADLQAGDFLIIQFGHNDQKEDAERHTDPYTTYQEYLKKYIDETRQKGGIPILATSIHRNNWLDTSINDSHGDYPPAMRDLATAENVPLLDMHVRTKELFEQLGQDYTTNNLFLNLEPGEYPNYPEGVSDNTHLQEEGAFRVSQLAIDALLEKSESFSDLEVLKNAVKGIGFVDTRVNNADYGSVLGGRFNTLNDSVTLQAQAYSGYALKEWTIDNEVVGTETNYTFYFDTDSTQITAHFDIGYRVTAIRSPSSGGIVEGAGTYVSGRTVKLTAIPRENWYFKNWTINDEVVGTDSVYTLVVGTENVTIQANFTDVYSPLNLRKEPNKVYYHNGEIYFEGAATIDEIQVADLSGRTILHKYQINSSILTISNRKPGIYIAKWKVNGSQTGSIKFIINK